MSQTNVSTLALPNVHVLANGVPLVQAFTDVSWSLPLAYQGGRFWFTKAFTPNDPNPPAWWAATGNKTIDIEILAAPDGSNYTSVFTGAVDSHRIQPFQRTISVAGRDGSAVFVDERISKTYRNQTSSQIAESLAAEHGMQAVVTATTTRAGRYYDQDHDTVAQGSFARSVSEWDLLCTLGQKEGIVPYVLGNTLYFQTIATPSSVPLWVRDTGQGYPASNALTLTLERALTMARDVSVEVRTWHSRSAAVFIGKAVTKTAAHAAGGAPAPVTKYVFYIAGLTHAQAQVAAQRLAQDIARHERRVSHSLPGVLAMGFTPANVFTLTGTGTDYDGIDYFPDSANFAMSRSGGFTANFSSKNYSPLALYDGASGASLQ